MKQLVRFGRLAALLTGVLLGGPGLTPTAQAQQCPTSASCTPGNAPAGNLAFGFGIVKVALGSLNSQTGVQDGYQNYSCSRQANLLVGSPYALTVQTSVSGPENVRVWIDYNNDGSFAGTDELVFSSDNRTVHTGSITPPASARTGWLGTGARRW